MLRVLRDENKIPLVTIRKKSGEIISGKLNLDEDFHWNNAQGHYVLELRSGTRVRGHTSDVAEIRLVRKRREENASACTNERHAS